MFENDIHIDFMDDNKMGGSKQKFYASTFIRFTTIAFCDLYF